MWQEYKDFLFRGNLLELAAAFILGVSFNAVVQALANDVILGTIAAMIGLDSIMEMTIGPVLVGTLIGAVLSFLVVATVLFLVLRASVRFRRRQRVPDEPALEPEDIALLREIRDLLAEPRR